MLTVNVFLIVREASVKSTLEILPLGKRVNKVLSVEFSNFVDRILRSVTFKFADGRVPSTTPDTVVTPEMLTVLEATLTTLPVIGSSVTARSL